MLRTATPPVVWNVGRDRRLRLANSTSGAMASRRFRACVFCLAEKTRRSGSVTSGREANSLDWFRFERSARAVQSGPDSNGCLRNFSCASTGKDDRAYSRWPEPRFCPLPVFRNRKAPSCTFQRIVRSDQPVTFLTISVSIHSSVPTLCPSLSPLFPPGYEGSHGIGGGGELPTLGPGAVGTGEEHPPGRVTIRTSEFRTHLITAIQPQLNKCQGKNAAVGEPFWAKVQNDIRSGPSASGRCARGSYASARRNLLRCWA